MPDHTQSQVPLDELEVWLAAYREAKDNASRWGELAERAKQHITGALEQAGAEVGTLGGRPAVKYTTVTSVRVDTKKLRATHPDVAEACSVMSTTRRFTLVEPKGGVAT